MITINNINIILKNIIIVINIKVEISKEHRKEKS